MNTLLLGTLIGVFVAVAGRATVRWLANKISARRVLRIYDCARDGDVHEPAALRHAWGGPACDLRSHDEVWAYSAARPIPGREHTMFGPYTNDFGRPGFFAIRFNVVGRGFERTDDPVLVFDVMQAPFDQQRGFSVVGQRTVRAREFTGQFQDFDVECYTSGIGVYEYRARVYERSFLACEHELLFRHVRVQRHFSVWDVI